jgi:hypothetical protein
MGFLKEACFFHLRIDVTTQTQNNLSDITDPVDGGNFEENRQEKKQHQDSRHDYSGSGFGEHERIDKEKDDDQIDNRTVRNFSHDFMSGIIFVGLLYTNTLNDALV